MKYLVIFVLCLVALAAAAPQLITTYPTGYAAPFARTFYGSPYYNGYYPGFYGSRLVAPGLVAPTFI